MSKDTEKKVASSVFDSMLYGTIAYASVTVYKAVMNWLGASGVIPANFQILMTVGGLLYGIKRNMQ